MIHVLSVNHVYPSVTSSLLKSQQKNVKEAFLLLNKVVTPLVMCYVLMSDRREMKGFHTFSEELTGIVQNNILSSKSA